MNHRSPAVVVDEHQQSDTQREAEAFGPLLIKLRRDLDATLVVVEHDIPLIMAISDRVQCLAAGRTLALGTPQQVRENPEVVAAYLGTDERVIARSGVAAQRRPRSAQKAPSGR